MEWGAVNIHGLRKAAGMTQAELAEWLGVTVKQVKHLEHQRRNPSGPASRLLDILAQQVRMEDHERVQVLGADVGAPPKPVAEESATADSEVAQEGKIEEAREIPPSDHDDAFAWQ
jgi:transcriptional regulator with XRE-family HTH domain